MSTTQARLTRYLTLAAIPAAGAAGHTTADIFHYGGPAIQITAANNFTSTGTTFYGGVFNDSTNIGARTLLYGRSLISESATKEDLYPMLGLVGNKEGSLNKASSPKGPKQGNFSDNKAVLLGDVYWGVDSNGVLKNFASGDMISSGAGFPKSDVGVLSIDVYATMNEEVVEDFRVGNFLTEDGEEVRGYVGFARDEDSFGWIDLGWDGTTLTIYDWAYNDDGTILAGQTVAVPGGAGLAALAMGAAGLRRRRKRSA